jgi:TolA-binding protein
MRASHLIAGSLLALSATGCLATKGDIRLLQDELRAARASAARSDSLERRRSDSLTAAVANLERVMANNARDAGVAQQRFNDSLRSLAGIVRSNNIATAEQLRSLNDEIAQLREISRQNARRPVEAARPTVTVQDSQSVATTPTPSGAPSSAALLVNGRSQAIQGSCGAARRAFQELLTQYPDSPEAPEALWSIGQSYVDCAEGGNPAKADSVHRLVVERYPKSDFAPMSLYKRAEMLREAGNPTEARPLYTRIVCEYPKSTVYPQALSRIGGRPPARC